MAATFDHGALILEVPVVHDKAGSSIYFDREV